jgi:four helix bundle protein
MFRFESLDIWKLSLDYADKLYDIANLFPTEERFALSDQLRRAAVSISNNIAEGSGSATNKNFSSFLDISIKSTLETVNVLFLACMREYITEKERQSLYSEAEILIKKIRAFKNKLSN